MKHIAAVGIIFWSHSRGLATLLANLILIEHDLFVTFFVPDDLRERVEQLHEHDFELDLEQRKRLRVVFMDTSQAVDPTGGDKGPYFGSPVTFIDRYCEPLLKGEAIEDFEALPRPNALISDQFAYDVLNHARASGFTGETIVWLAIEAGAIAMQHEWLRVMSQSTEPRLLKLEGIPPRYNYELRPSSTATEEQSNPLSIDTRFKLYFEGVMKGHRMLCAFSRRLAPTGIETLRDNFFPKLTAIHSQFAPSFWAQSRAFPTNDPLFDWLDRRKRQSVALISFGSHQFPVVYLWMLDTLVDSLNAAGIPFVLLMGSVTAGKVKDEDQELMARIKSKIEEAGSIHTGFIDQPLAFRHPAVGWAVMHGGAGGIIEALVCNLPIVFFQPYAYDQPLNANLVAETLDAGFECFEARDKLVGRPIAGKGDYRIRSTPESLRAELDKVWKQAKGPMGARKRSHAARAGKLLREEHEEHGEEYLRELLELL